MKFLRMLVTLYFTLFYRIKVEGLENIPQKGAAILCSNHIAQRDMFLIGYKTKRVIHYMAKEELFRNPIMAKFITFLGAFPVKRGFVDSSMYKNVFKLLSEGHIVGIFPEGTRMKNRERGSVKIKTGAALFATEALVPIIPVGISGKYRLFGKIRVSIGKPFMLNPEKEGKPGKEELDRKSKFIMEKIYALTEKE